MRKAGQQKSYSHAQARDPQIFQKSSNHLKILDSKRVTWSKIHTKDTNIRCHYIKFGYLGGLAQGIGAPWLKHHMQGAMWCIGEVPHTSF
jgi:hypothetical protein